MICNFFREQVCLNSSVQKGWKLFRIHSRNVFLLNCFINWSTVLSHIESKPSSSSFFHHLQFLRPSLTTAVQQSVKALLDNLQRLYDFLEYQSSNCVPFSTCFWLGVLLTSCHFWKNFISSFREDPIESTLMEIWMMSSIGARDSALVCYLKPGRQNWDLAPCWGQEVYCSSTICLRFCTKSLSKLADFIKCRQSYT